MLSRRNVPAPIFDRLAALLSRNDRITTLRASGCQGARDELLAACARLKHGVLGQSDATAPRCPEFQSVDCVGAQDSASDVSRAPRSGVGFVNRARRSVVPIVIDAAVMTGEVQCGGIMTSDRPAHCADTTCAEPAHMGCAHAPEILSAEATDMGSTETTEMHSAETTEARSAEAAEMRSAETTDMGCAHRADMTAATAVTAAATAAASVGGANCGKSEHDDRCCCSENLRHDDLRI
jgi:hypothetical protein